MARRSNSGQSGRNGGGNKSRYVKQKNKNKNKGH